MAYSSWSSDERPLLMKTFPFYRNVYYAGKMSYDTTRDVFKPWKRYRYNEIVRVGPSWVVMQGDRFIVHPAYSWLMRRTYNRKKLK